MRRASIFTNEGEFARSFTPNTLPAYGGLRPQLVGTFGDGTILGYLRMMADPPQDGIGMVRPDYLLLRYDREGALMDSLGVVPGEEIAIIQGIIMGMQAIVRRTQLAVGERAFYVAYTDSFVVTSYSPEGDVLHVSGKPHEAIPVTRSDLGALPANFPTPSTYPAISSILLDSAGNLWVQEFRKDEAEGPAVWWVFNPDGMGSVEMPDRFRPLQIGDDMVLGVAQDSLDVEHVELHQLSRESSTAVP